MTNPDLTTQEPQLAVEICGAVGGLIFSNPARRNAVTVGMWEAIPAALDRLAADESVRVVVVRGAGATFIAGADISEFERKRATADATAHYDRIARTAQERLSSFSKPTVAVVQGACYGAGVSLAVCCDIRIASENARFAIPAGKLGLGYRASGIKALMDLVGPARTLDLFYSADAIDAARAFAIGLVEHVVPDGDFAAFAQGYCERTAALAPLTLAAAKTAARAIGQAGDAYDRDLCERVVQACFESEDYAEGRRAFAEKRKPVFRGR
jgi:enoyl-CoA hydratase/carnithine racemase